MLTLCKATVRSPLHWGLTALPSSIATPVANKKNSLTLSKPLSSRVVSLPTISKEHTVPEIHDNLAGIYATSLGLVRGRK